MSKTTDTGVAVNIERASQLHDQLWQVGRDLAIEMRDPSILDDVERITDCLDIRIARLQQMVNDDE